MTLQLGDVLADEIAEWCVIGHPFTPAAKRSTCVKSVKQPAVSDDPNELVFPCRCRHAQADEFFPRAVERAQVALKTAGKDASGLNGDTWHCSRHTLASRLVMASVDLRSVKTSAVGGRWRWSDAMLTWRRSIYTMRSSDSLGKWNFGVTSAEVRTPAVGVS